MSERTLIEDTAATMARIKRDVCEKLGHKMQFAGGANAGCGTYCYCSVPVNECERCGASDYGHNQEAGDVREQCRAGQRGEGGE